MRSRPSLQIRQYQLSDHDAVWELHNLGLNQMGAHLGNGPWDDDLHDIGRQYLEDGEMLVGTVGGKIVAMGGLKKRTDTMGEIKRMRVHPDYQRRGYGQAILSALEQRARELGLTDLRLDTTTRQTPARKLYEKNGYRERERGRVGQFEVIFYEKRLSGASA